MASMTKTTIDFLRHGECQGGEIFRGSGSDVALSDVGWQQMRDATQLKDQAPWSKIISSPLQRCRLFANELAEKHALPITVEDEFREIHFGSWEGRLRSDVMQEEEQAVRAFWSDPEDGKPPGGESIRECHTRLVAALDHTVQAHRGEHLLLVQHGGTIRILLSHMLLMPLASTMRWEVPFACFSRIVHYHSDEHCGYMLHFHQRQALLV